MTGDENTKIIMEKVLHEKLQGHDTRKHLYTEIEKHLDKPVISYFTSFNYPVMITDDDANALEGLLQKHELSNGFYLLLSSPGGDGLAAERIINICRSYSDTNEFGVIVPGKAKSAATMICLGANEIMMGKTSELGPVDPQIVMEENNELKRFSLYNIVKSYKSVFNHAVKSDGNMEPYLHQLSVYDARDIEEYKSMCSLSKDIVIKALKSGMLSSLTEDEIKNKIEIFLTPKTVKVHGRPLYIEDIENCDLNIHVQDVKSDLWTLIYELYYRLNSAVSFNNTAKIIEDKNNSIFSKIKQ